MKSTIGIITVFIILGALAPTALACSCLPLPTVLDQFETAESVVVAKVVAFDKVGDPAGGTDNETVANRTIPTLRMVVRRSFKGKFKPGDELRFGQGGGGDCTMGFPAESIDSEMLFYLAPPRRPRIGLTRDEANPNAPLLFFAYICGRSRPVDAAAHDLLYLDNLAKARGRTRLSGTVRGMPKTSPVFANMPIEIIGPTKKLFIAKTDRNAVFEVYDLPAGDYIVRPKAPPGWKFVGVRMTVSILANATGQDRDAERTVRLGKARHAAIDVYLNIDNAIRGRVSLPNGNPVEFANVTVVSADELADGSHFPEFSQDAAANKNGEFELRSIPPGRYRVYAAAERFGETSTVPDFTYYPSARNLADAGIVVVGMAKNVENVNITLNEDSEFRTISGTVLDNNGEPATYINIIVESEPAGNFSDRTVTTDHEGRFTVTLERGATGKLFVLLKLTPSDTEDCPELEALTNDSGTESELRSEEIPFVLSDDLLDLRLKLAFSLCEKKD